MEAKEELLFKILCRSHLEQGGKIGLGGCSWKREWDSVNERYQYLKRTRNSDRTLFWNSTEHAVADIEATVKRLYKSLDYIAFYPSNEELSGSGATWRILKNDMSFLRIVLKKDAQTMGFILRRLDAVMRDSIYGEEIRKAAEKN